MKATFTKKEMRDALKHLNLMKRGDEDGKDIVLSTQGNSSLCVSRSADFVNMSVAIPSCVEQEGSVRIDFDEFNSALKGAVSSVGVIVTNDPDDGNFSASFLDDSDVIALQSAIRAPVNSLVELHDPVSISFQGVVSKILFMRALPAILPFNKTQRRLMSFCRLFVNDKRLNLISAHSFSGVWASDDWFDEPDDFDCLISFNMALVASKLPDLNSKITFSYDDHSVSMSFDNIKMSTSRRNEIFFNVIDLCNNQPKPLSSVVFNPNELISALNRLNPIAKKLDFKTVTLDIQDESTSLFVSGSDDKILGKTSVSSSLSGKSVSVSVNGEQLSKMLKPLAISSNAVKINISKNDKPLMISLLEPFENDYKGLLVPITQKK